MPLEKDYWDARFGEGSYATDPDPPGLLAEHLDALPRGRALDVATGTGRIAVFLAAAGYDVDALDQSRVGMGIARTRAADRSLSVNWIQADAREFAYPTETYDLVTVRSFRVLDRLADLKAALKPGGVLFAQDHLRTERPMDTGPRDDRYRLTPNELLRCNLDLTVLRYEEFVIRKPSGKTGAYAQLLGQKPDGGSYPVLRRDAGAAET